MKALIIVPAVLVAGLLIAGFAGGKHIQERDAKYGVKTTLTGAKIYTVVWKGCEYVVVEKHKAISICPVGESTNLPASEDLFWKEHQKGVK